MPTTRIYVDRTAIEKNKEDGGHRCPFIIVTDEVSTSANRVKIRGECELIYDPLTSPSNGITAYLETEDEVIIS